MNHQKQRVKNNCFRCIRTRLGIVLGAIDLVTPFYVDQDDQDDDKDQDQDDDIEEEGDEDKGDAAKDPLDKDCSERVIA